MAKEFWGVRFSKDGKFDGTGFADVVIDDEVAVNLKAAGKTDDEIVAIKAKAIEAYYEWLGNPEHDIIVSVKPYSDAKKKVKS